MHGDEPLGILVDNEPTGTNDGIPRLDIPTVRFTDGPAGVRRNQATGLPAPIALAATWNPALARLYGRTVGEEARLTGHDVVLGPNVNIMRIPMAGRTFEAYGEDPHLASRITVSYVEALQTTGVIANVKHYVANNQESDRFVTNALVDQRTLREIYLPAFEAAVKEAGTGSVMAAYNRVNNAYMTESRALQVDILKQEWGFPGFILSDFYATAFAALGPTELTEAVAQLDDFESLVPFVLEDLMDFTVANGPLAFANNGLDLEMPIETVYTEALLRAALESGQINQTVIDEHVFRYLRTLFAFGVFDRPAFPTDGDIPIDEHNAITRQIEDEAIVLLKNDGDALPLQLDDLQRIAVIGAVADDYKNGGGSSNVEPFMFVTPLEGIRNRAGDAAEVVFDDGSNLVTAINVAANADVAIVVAADNQTEFQDRPCLSLDCPPLGSLDAVQNPPPEAALEDPLIQQVASAQPNTIVVLEAGSPVTMPWIDQVPAVLNAAYPGQEGGNAIAGVLFGDVNPSGRLPFTIPTDELDRPATDPAQYPGIAFNAEYSEGVFMGYRHYDENAIEPLFAFGHGLSYTRFGYAGLDVNMSRDGGSAAIDVTNTGARAGREVVQLYLGLPETAVNQPPRWLRAFEKIALAPGDTKRVQLPINRRDLSYWDVGQGRWVVADGCYSIMVGASSRDIRVSDEVCL